jgi:serine/threonine protein kinase
MGDLIGSTLGMYQIVALQGHGGMADVYKAYQPSLDRFVAIKILHSRLADKSGFVQRFEREGATHPHLRPTPLSSTILPARPISSSVNRGLSQPA